MTEPGREEPSSSLLFGAGSITQGQLVALTSVTLVLLLLLTANMAVYALYRSAVRQEEGEGERQRHKTANLWVYRLHRTTTTTTPVPSTPAQSASQQILRKLQVSHHNLQARLAAADNDNDDYDSKKRDNSLRREEAQALEELEVTTDLFRHEASSCSGSRRSSLSALSGAGSSRRSSVRELLLLRGRQIWRGGGVSAFSSRRRRRRSNSQGRSGQRDPNSTLSDLDPDWDFGDDTASTHRQRAGGCQDAAGSAALPDSAVPAHSDPDPSSYDLDVAAALAALDMASAMHDLDLDKVSMSSVTFADFENDPADFEETPGKKRRSRSRSSSRGSHDNRGDHSRSLPVAEFHNEAFEFSETRAAVERMNDVEL